MPSDQPRQWPTRTGQREQPRAINPNTAQQQSVQQATQQGVQQGQQPSGAAGQPNQQPNPAQFQGGTQSRQTMQGPSQGQIPQQQPAPAGQPMPQGQPRQRQQPQGRQQTQFRGQQIQPQGQQVQQPQQVQRPRQTSQPQTPQQPPGPGQVQLVEHGEDYVHVRFRDPDAFDTIRTPDWAAHAARSVSEGAEVRTGKLKGRDDWKIESVLIRRPVDERTAVQKAQQIVRKIEE